MAESVQSNVVVAQPRNTKGKGPARRLRAQGLIPAVVYGGQGQTVPISVDPEAIQTAIATPLKFNTLISLKMDAGSKNVLLKDYQVDPVSREMLHADFLEVALDKPVHVEVPVVTTGKAEGVVAGGILTISAYEVALEALPNKIPAQLEVDVTALKIGQSIHISELKAPEGCKFKYTTDYVVAFVAVPEKEEVVAPVVEAVPVEGAAAAAPGVAAPGAAPGAPGAAAPAAGAAAPAAGGAAPAAGAPGKGAAAAPAKGAPPAKGEKKK